MAELCNMSSELCGCKSHERVAMFTRKSSEKTSPTHERIFAPSDQALGAAVTPSHDTRKREDERGKL